MKNMKLPAFVTLLYNYHDELLVQTTMMKLICNQIFNPGCRLNVSINLSKMIQLKKGGEEGYDTSLKF